MALPTQGEGLPSQEEVAAGEPVHRAGRRKQTTHAVRLGCCAMRVGRRCRRRRRPVPLPLAGSALPASPCTAVEAAKEAVADAVDEAKTALPDAKEAKDAVVGALADVKQEVAAAVAPQAGGAAERQNGGASTSTAPKTPARECRRWLPTPRCARACQRRRPPRQQARPCRRDGLPLQHPCRCCPSACPPVPAHPARAHLCVSVCLYVVAPTLTRALTTREAKAALEAQAEAAAAKSVQASTIFKALFA